MALNVSYTQQYYQAIDATTLKSVTRDILANAQAKSATNEFAKRVDVDLYNGEIDALTARQVAMSGAGLQVTLNNNLETAIKFLQTNLPFYDNFYKRFCFIFNFLTVLPINLNFNRKAW